jgi:hypothetical protein
MGWGREYEIAAGCDYAEVRRRAGWGRNEGMEGWLVGWLVHSVCRGWAWLVDGDVSGRGRGRGMLTWGFCGCGIIVLFVLQVVGDYYFQTMKERADLVSMSMQVQCMS